MEEQKKQYLCIDLKSFYASVECIERGLDPFRANLVVADESRTDKTICLAVSPALKSFGVSGRPRLFEVKQTVRECNYVRRNNLFGRSFSGSSTDAVELRNNKTLELDFLVAPPQMKLYMQYSATIFGIYLNHVSFEDVFPYSVDEVFIDITPYLALSGYTSREFAMKIIRDVYKTTGITATAGIGTNMYLAKVAMDIVAKKMPPDSDGVRIAELDEQSYRQKLWSHRPLTDFWQIGRGISSKLEKFGLFTMGDIALLSVSGDDLLFRMFGVNAELIIDHAWGWEPCTIEDVKNYRPTSCSLTTGQVLSEPTRFDTARIIVSEMADALSLDLVEKGLKTSQVVLTVGYDVENLKNDHLRSLYNGAISCDSYGRPVPKHAHGTENSTRYTSSSRAIVGMVLSLFDRVVDPRLLIRRLNVSVCKLLDEESAEKLTPCEQMDFFTDYDEQEKARSREEKEHKLQKVIVSVKKKHGKNMLLKGKNYLDGATARERNEQVGGHKG